MNLDHCRRLICSHGARDNRGERECFLWLLKEMPNVRATEHSQYYDADRMKSVIRMSHDLIQRREVPEEFLELYRETHRKIYGDKEN